MYHKGYGIIETLAPVHVGATAGEETGNLNLIFRDQFTQTGIILGSSIRGRLRAEMRQVLWFKEDQAEQKEKVTETDNKTRAEPELVNQWYGRAAEKERDSNEYEAAIKIEYASIVWIPVFCPGYPVVWVSCPRLLERYKRITGLDAKVPEVDMASKALGNHKKLFFTFGFLDITQPKQDLSSWFPRKEEKPAVIVGDGDIALVHDMALFRQSRVALETDQKVAKKGAFFDVEALPEGTILSFPVAMKKTKKWEDWNPLEEKKSGALYLGGLESVGLGHCSVDIKQYGEV